MKLGAKIPEDSSVIIEFKGVEKTKWMMKSPIIGDDSYLESNGQREITNVSQVLYTFSEQNDNLSLISEGKQLHSFPFEILLPAELPSSILYYFGRNNRVIIRYKIRVTLKKLYAKGDESLIELQQKISASRAIWV